MRIVGLVTSVDFSDYLAVSMPRWIDGLDGLMVVTSHEDYRTNALCQGYGVRCLKTDDWHRDGAEFNKAAGLERGLQALKLESADDWVLFLDADVVPPPGWRATLNRRQPQVGSVYGASRQDEQGRRIADAELAGFFQLWHPLDPVVQDRPLLGSWRSAAGYDSAFLARWPQDRRVDTGIVLTHLGEPGVHWCGRGRSERVRAMLAERGVRNGWRHERLDGR